MLWFYTWYAIWVVFAVSIGAIIWALVKRNKK